MTTGVDFTVSLFRVALTVAVAHLWQQDPLFRGCEHGGREFGMLPFPPHED